jgi:hypothetical protein
MTTDIDRYNPYESFNPGQKEAITQILDTYDAGEHVIELNAPTAAGKSLNLFVIGQVLAHEYDLGRIVYTTPLVALVDQLQDNPMFKSMPVLKGKKNYVCEKLSDAVGEEICADDCPFKSWKKAISKDKLCASCEYRMVRQKFMDAKFGATTFARYMVDPSIRNETSVMLIDESASLEKTLIDRATLVLPKEVNLNNLKESMIAYYHEVMKEIEELKGYYDALAESDDDVDQMIEMFQKITKLERVSSKCTKIINHLENNDPYIIDKERKFRLLEGKSEFKKLIQGLDLCVLASGTPATGIIADS